MWTGLIVNIEYAVQFHMDLLIWRFSNEQLCRNVLVIHDNFSIEGAQYIFG